MSRWQSPRFRDFFPRSFMGRTLLMIIVPLLLLQIGITVLTVQRYYGQVTEQLSEAVIFDIRYLESNATDSSDFKTDLKEFGYIPVSGEDVPRNPLGRFDLSGHNILQNFRNEFGSEVTMGIAEDKRVIIGVPTKFGEEELLISRAKLAPINPHQILINTFAFLIASLLIVLLFLRSQVRSIRRLSKAAEAFGRGESIEYQPTGADEIRLAGQNFLKMRARILRQRKQRNLLLSGISHDLRTPLTRFKLEVDMLDDEQTREAMLRDVEDMEMLINSFLAYAQGDEFESMERVSLPRFLQKLVESEPQVTLNKIADVNVHIRPQLMRRAIINILENAKRFSDNIEISTQASQKNVEILIDDDGPGIKPEDRDAALLAFQSLDHSRNQDKGAHAGLGLAIAADAMRINKGEIELKNAPQGGLRVVLTLPIYR